MGWDGREGNGRGEKGSWARAHPGLHVRAARCVTTRCAPAARPGRRSPSTGLRAPPHRVQERPPARPPTRLLSAPPPPRPSPRRLRGSFLRRPVRRESGRRQICPGGTEATSLPVIAKQTRLKYWIGLNRDKIYAFAANLFVQLYLKALD